MSSNGIAFALALAAASCGRARGGPETVAPSASGAAVSEPFHSDVEIEGPLADTAYRALGCWGWSPRLGAAACTIGDTVGDSGGPFQVVFPGGNDLAPITIGALNQSTADAALEAEVERLRAAIVQGGFVKPRWRNGRASGGATLVDSLKPVSPSGDNSAARQDVGLALRWGPSGPSESLVTIDDCPCHLSAQMAALPGGRLLITVAASYADEGFYGTRMSVFWCGLADRHCEPFEP